MSAQEKYDFQCQLARDYEKANVQFAGLPLIV